MPQCVSEGSNGPHAMQVSGHRHCCCDDNMAVPKLAIPFNDSLVPLLPPFLTSFADKISSYLLYA